MAKTTDTSALSRLACEAGLDAIEDRLRANIRGPIEAVFNEEPDSFLGAFATVGRPGRRRAIATATGTVRSPVHLAPRRSAYPAPALKTKLAGSVNGAQKRCRATSA